ncbi:hypothetical protein D9C73_028301 [Xyrichtys novacula]|nr:hypothetical protein D9C73_028301 [Xyrichtys novacula]
MEDIREAVLVVLPSLPEDKVKSLLNKLASIGVESKPDLQFFSVPGKHKMLHWDQPNLWHQDNQVDLSKKQEAKWEEEQWGHPSCFCTSQKINGL